jgi:N-alpha-acetyl-L-2,4-diaminobutyrate deacetylase
MRHCAVFQPAYKSTNLPALTSPGYRVALAGITHRIAAFVRTHIWPRVHVVLDLHSGGQVARFAPCASFHPLDDPRQSAAVEETARWFGTPLIIIYQNLTPGLLPGEAERLGKITVGTELGWGAAVQAEGVRYGRQGVLAAALRHGQLRGTIEPIAHHKANTQIKAAMVDRECFTVAPFAGHYEPLVECGQIVRAGQPVGLLHDFDHFDQAPWPAAAGVDGVVIAQAWAAPIPRGQHIVVVGEGDEVTQPFFSCSLSPVLRGEGWGEGRFVEVRNSPNCPSP